MKTNTNISVESAKKIIADKKYLMEQIRSGKPLDKAELKNRGIQIGFVVPNK